MIIVLLNLTEGQIFLYTSVSHIAVYLLYIYKNIILMCKYDLNPGELTADVCRLYCVTLRNA